MLSPFLTKATFRPKSRLPQILGSQLLQKKTSRRAPTPQTGNQKAFETARGLERLLQAALPAKRCARLAHREHARKAQQRRCGHASQLRSQPQPASSGGVWRRSRASSNVSKEGKFAGASARLPCLEPPPAGRGLSQEGRPPAARARKYRLRVVLSHSTADWQHAYVVEAACIRLVPRMETRSGREAVRCFALIAATCSCTGSM